MTDENDARLTRQLIREELDASNSYEEKAQATSDPEAAKVYRDISREEKVHAGELQALLDREDPESTEAMKEGMEETGLEGSFKDIFDRKREDYIHKSVYGTHVEKANKAKNNKYIQEALGDEQAAEQAIKEGRNQRFISQEDAKERLGIDPFSMTLADFYLQGFIPEKEPPRGQRDKVMPNNVLDTTAKQAVQTRDKVLAGQDAVRSMPPRKVLGDEFKRIFNADERAKRKLRPHNPTGRMIPKIDELNKLPPNAQNDTFLSPEEAKIQAMERQKTEGSGEDGELHFDRRELLGGSAPSPNMGTEWKTHYGTALDYDSIFDPDEIGKEEVEMYQRRVGDRPVKDPVAPNSAKRPWLTFKYFGNHLLQATPIVVPARDRYGRQIMRTRRVPVMKEVDDPDKGKIMVPTGEFEDKVEEATEFVMNYRISKTGKDIQFEQGPYQFRTRWDPSALNPATKEFTGAFVPVSITTPDGTVLYDINDVGFTDADPWALFEEDLAKRALVNGVEEYIRNPKFREKLAQIQLPNNYIQTTQYADEVAKMIKDADGGQTLARLKASLPPGMTLNKVIAQISKHYESLNQEIEAQKQAMKDDKTMLDTAVRMEAEARVDQYINEWINDKGIKGADGSDVSADTLGNYFDSNTETFHLKIGGRERVRPKQNFEAWVDHAKEYFDRDLRRERLKVLEEEQAEQDAIEERTNAEDKAIEDYLYKAFEKKLKDETGLEPSIKNNVGEQLRAQASKAAHDLLYGDGSAFQKVLSESGVLEPDVDPREYLLNQAGFNWDIVEHNRNLKMRQADRALAEEVATLADPRYHEKVKTDLNEIRAKQKAGILGMLAARQADKEIANRKNATMDYTLPSALQAYANRKGFNGFYNTDGSLILDANTILDKNNPFSTKLKEQFDQRLFPDGANKPSDEAELNRIYTEQLHQRIPDAILESLSAVKGALQNDSDGSFRNALKNTGSFKNLNINKFNDLMDKIADPNTPDSAVIDEIQRNTPEGMSMLRAVLNANNFLMGKDIKERLGVPLTGGTAGLKYKEGQKELAGMFRAALQGAYGPEFDALREVARKHTLDIIEGKNLDPKYKLVREKVREVFRATLDQEVKEYYMRLAEQHHNVPRAPGRPRRGTKNYDARILKYNAKMDQHWRAVQENYDAIMEEYNAYMADPKKIAEAKQLLFNVAKFKSLSTISKDEDTREMLASVLGHDDNVMMTTGFRPLMDSALAEGDTDFIDQQVKNERPTAEEEYQQRIAKYKGEGMSDAQALIESFKDMGYSDRQARNEAREYLKLRLKDRDESGELAPIYGDLISSSGWGVGDINIDGGLGPGDLDSKAYTKTIMSALTDYYVNHLKELKETAPDSKELVEFNNAKTPEERKQLMGEFLAKQGLMLPLKTKKGFKPNWDAFFGNDPQQSVRMDPIAGSEDGLKRVVYNKHPEYILANNILNDFIGKKFSLRDAESLGMPIRDVQMSALKSYDSNLDRIIRGLMIDNLTEKLKNMEIKGKKPYENRPRLAKIDATNQINQEFHHVIGREDLNEKGNEQFLSKLQEYGIAPDQIRQIQVQAMKESNTPLYSDFISPYFESSGRTAGASRDNDELDLFEGLSRGFQTQQNPALAQAWNDYYTKAGTLSPSQAAEVRRRLGLFVGDHVQGNRDAHKAHTQELRDFLKQQHGPLAYHNGVEQNKRDLLDAFEGDSALKEHYNNHIRRTNQLMEALGYGPVNMPEEHNAYPEFEEFPEVDGYYKGDERYHQKTGEKINPMKSERIHGRYNMLVYDAVQTYAKKHDGNLEYLLKGWEEIDPVEFQKELSDSAMRRMMYLSKTGELPPDTIQDDSDRIARAVYSSLVYDPKTTLNFTDEDVKRIMWNNRYKKDIKPKIKDDRGTSDYLEEKKKKNVKFNEKQAKREAESKKIQNEHDKRLEDLRSKLETEEGDPIKTGVRDPEKVKRAEEAKAQGLEYDGKPKDGQIDHTTEVPKEQVEITDYTKVDPDTGENKVASAISEMGTQPMVEEQDFTATKGDNITISGQKEADRLRQSSVLTPTGRAPREDTTDKTYTIPKDTEKKTASAFDTPFADILSSKRSQTIRKNETGTVISTDTVSAPMTEQADAPQEQNSVEAGGFAELMKSKMASTHMMEEPSEEREDWIPMRNGYRRVTIGSGKDCVRNMMRNPPRSANAPGTRTRKV